MRFDAYLSQSFNDAAGLMVRPMEREDEDFATAAPSPSHRAKPPAGQPTYKH